MAWVITVTLQKRGTKDESTEWARFDSRGDAEGALQKLLSDISAAGDKDFITLASPGEIITFIKQDYRRAVARERKPSGSVSAVV
jgi:hypothetical protein